MLDQRQSSRDSSFAFLIGVVQVLQSESSAVPQQLQKISCRISAGDDHDVRDSRVHQRLNRIVDHRLVINRQQMLIRDGSQRVQTRTETTSKDDTFQEITSRVWSLILGLWSLNLRTHWPNKDQKPKIFLI